MITFELPRVETGAFVFGVSETSETITPTEFRGNAERIQTAIESEIILTGPTRTGKTRAILFKAYRLAIDYPGLRALIVRKQRTTLTETALVTFERDIIGLDHPLVVDGPTRRNRQSYNFDNGSSIVVGGLDKPGKILSSEYDLIIVPQAEELNLQDWEILITRLSGTTLPPEQQQIIGDCNPQGPYHWIYKRSIEGELKLWETYHRDNPLLWDLVANDWTEFGRAYIERLRASLTGTTADRLLRGLWVQAEGVVYSDFSASEDGNLIYDDPDLDDGSFELAFDDGYIDPRAILFILRRSTEIVVFDEIYHSRHLQEECVSETIDKCVNWFGSKLDDLSDDELEQLSDDDRDELAKIPRRLPSIAVGSPEAKVLHRHFRRSNIPVRTRGIPSVVEALEPVRRLIKDGNDHRSLKVHNRCKNLIEEMTGGYQYPEGSSRTSSEKPLDKNNHACDALRDWAWLRAR